jgi:hypothetical protein
MEKAPFLAQNNRVWVKKKFPGGKKPNAEEWSA